MAYTIIDTCIGCTACAKKCPVECIAGTRKELHLIDPTLCVDCGLCGYVCPVNAILDDAGDIATRLKPKETPKAKVDADLCTGCVFCLDVCPYHAIQMVDYDSVPGVNMVAVVDPELCLGCDHLCTSVCIKDAIELHIAVPPAKPKKKAEPVSA
ncbi:MAG: 4Fe-4S dicluster-binding protein [Planctomycetota bacterium]|jgi:ferredoxin